VDKREKRRSILGKRGDKEKLWNIDLDFGNV